MVLWSWLKWLFWPWPFGKSEGCMVTGGYYCTPPPRHSHGPPPSYHPLIIRPHIEGIPSCCIVCCRWVGHICPNASWVKYWNPTVFNVNHRPVCRDYHVSHIMSLISYPHLKATKQDSFKEKLVLHYILYCRKNFFLKKKISKVPVCFDLRPQF
jgi:hypothetical protein